MALPNEPAPSAGWLPGARRAVLALLAATGLAIAFGGFQTEPPPPDPLATTLAVSLALGAIVLRRFASSAVISAGTAGRLAAASLACAGGLGLLGLGVAFAKDSSETGLLFALAGFIFALRPAPPPSS